MHFDSKTYPLDCPEGLWEPLKRVQKPDRNINDEIRVAIAKHVADHGIELSEGEELVIETLLNEI